MKKIILLILIFSISTVLHAQQDDLGLWTTISLDKKITKKIKVNAEGELRLFNNATQLDNVFGDLSISYKFNKHFITNVGYRFYTSFDDEDLPWYYQHRFYLNGVAKKKWNDLEVAFKAQIQETYTSIYTSENGLIPKYIQRDKLQLQYHIYNTPFSPYLSGEIFYQFNYIGEKGFNKIRSCVGLEYEINANNKIEGYFLLENKFNTSTPSTGYIAGIKYSKSL